MAGQRRGGAARDSNGPAASPAGPFETPTDDDWPDPRADFAGAGPARRRAGPAGSGGIGDGSEGRQAGSARKGRGRRGRSGEREQADARTHADPHEVAREICLRQLAVRPRTRAELATALHKRGVDEAIAEEILDRYDEVGIIDDAAFAKAWVTSRHHGKGLARRALAGELRRKGVASDEVGEALDELDPSTEEATARALVARRLRAESSAAPDAVFRRLVGMLARKGYPAGLAIRVVKDALAERAELAEFADAIDPDALADAAGESDQ
jgi:regulatory protein